jgi:uncharacterized metal-binding protein
MNCLPMIAINDKTLIESLQKANVLVIDGCTVDCGRKFLEDTGIKEFNHLRLTDLGYLKEKTRQTEDVLNAKYEKSELTY